MKVTRPPRLQGEYALRILRQVLGSTKPAVLLLSLGVIVSIGLATNASFDLLSHLPRIGKDEKVPWLVDSILLAAPLVLLGILWICARSASEHVRVSVVQDDKPPPVRGLIIFLSPLGKDQEVVQSILDTSPPPRVTEAGLRAKFQGSWRIPLEAIAHHFERLEQIIVIASSDLKKSDGSTVRGTVHDAPTFVRLVRWITHAHDEGERITLKTQADFQSPSDPNDFAQGVNFEDVKKLADSVESAYRALHALEIPNYDVLVDVTGGQKGPTAAGTTVALAEGRRFQYVSTHDYHVRTYDVTYLV